MLASTAAVAEWCRTLIGETLEYVQTAIRSPLGFLTFFFLEIFLSFLAGSRHHTNVLVAGSLRVIF